MPEAWLRGPVQGVPPPLMPAAHALIDALEEIERAAAGLDPEELWLKPGGAASIGFHLRHAGGSIERLLTYARGERLSADQLAAIPAEPDPGDPPPGAEDLLRELRNSVDVALETYRSVAPEDLHQPREVGRARLPGTVHGLLFHLAEHTRRHAGQIVTTAKIIRGLKLRRESAEPR
ncbi:MAG: DinB family protein [Longimicrobiales bacterium]